MRRRRGPGTAGRRVLLGAPVRGGRTADRTVPWRYLLAVHGTGRPVPVTNGAARGVPAPVPTRAGRRSRRPAAQVRAPRSPGVDRWGTVKYDPCRPSVTVRDEPGRTRPRPPGRSPRSPRPAPPPPSTPPPAAVGSHATLPGVLSDVPVAVLVIDQNEQRRHLREHRRGGARRQRRPPGRRRHVGRRGRPHRPRRRAAGQQHRPAVHRRAGPTGHGRGRAAGAGRAARSRSGPTPTTAGSDQLLWVTGFPLSQADSDQQLALVVFLQLEPAGGGGRPGGLPAGAARAGRASPPTSPSPSPIPRKPDNPLVWVNPSFTRITGYEARRGRGPQLPLPAGAGDRSRRRGRDPRRRRRAAHASPRRC